MGVKRKGSNDCQLPDLLSVNQAYSCLQPTALGKTNSHSSSRGETRTRIGSACMRVSSPFTPTSRFFGHRQSPKYMSQRPYHVAGTVEPVYATWTRRFWQQFPLSASARTFEPWTIPRRSPSPAPMSRIYFVPRNNEIFFETPRSKPGLSLSLCLSRDAAALSVRSRLNGYIVPESVQDGHLPSAPSDKPVRRRSSSLPTIYGDETNCCPRSDYLFAINTQIQGFASLSLSLSLNVPQNRFFFIRSKFDQRGRFISGLAVNVRVTRWYEEITSKKKYRSGQ